MGEQGSAHKALTRKHEGQNHEEDSGIDHRKTKINLKTGLKGADWTHLARTNLFHKRMGFLDQQTTISIKDGLCSTS
jgi:hypothetical protein